MTSTAHGLVAALMAAGLLIAPAAPAFAQGGDQNASSQKGTVSIGTFQKWHAWQGTDANGMICYISSAPQKSEPTGVNRDPVHFLVIYRKALGIKDEVQTLIGYPFNTKDANASASVDGKTYPMVTEGSAAWLASAGDEPGFVEAMKKGRTLVVKGTSQRGTDTTDTYSLMGVTAAMAAIDKACA